MELPQFLSRSRWWSLVVDQVSEALKNQGKSLLNSKVLVLGATFKENVTDLRNSKAADLSERPPNT